MISRHKNRRSQWNSEFMFRTTSARRPSTAKLVLGSPRTAFPRTIALISFSRITVVHDGNPYQANSTIG